MKKILFTTLILLSISNISFAAMTVEQARSREQLGSEGYSEATINLVQRESGEFNPKPTNKFQKFGFRFWRYMDPAAPTARDDVKHDIKLYPSYSDL